MKEKFSRSWGVLVVFFITISAIAASFSLAYAGQLALNWADNSNNELGFKIYRQTATGSVAHIATVGANIVSFTDSSVLEGQNYCYLVRAYNSTGESSASNGVCANLPISSATGDSGSTSGQVTTSTSSSTSSPSPSSNTSDTTTFDNNHVDKIGVFRPSTGEWLLDLDSNEKWDGCNVDACVRFSNYKSGDLPITGDWTGRGTTQLGLFRPSTGEWFLDGNGDRAWNGCASDLCVSPFGISGDLPVSGDWNGTGISKIGTFRPSNGYFYLDLNGNEKWDGCSVDACVRFSIYKSGDLPITGDWTGRGTTQLGFFRPSTGEWFLNGNGDRAWNGCATDICVSPFGTGDLPVSGDWNGTGISKIGTFRPSKGYFYLDLNGNEKWNGCTLDLCLSYGNAGDIPVVGKW